MKEKDCEMKCPECGALYSYDSIYIDGNYRCPLRFCTNDGSILDIINDRRSIFTTDKDGNQVLRSKLTKNL